MIVFHKLKLKAIVVQMTFLASWMIYFKQVMQLQNENNEVKFDKTNVQAELLFCGSLYKEPDLYLSYGESTRSKFDFSDPATRFFELFVVLSLPSSTLTCWWQGSDSANLLYQPSLPADFLFNKWEALGTGTWEGENSFLFLDPECVVAVDSRKGTVLCGSNIWISLVSLFTLFAF